MAVVVRLDEMDGDVHTSYEAYDPALLEQMELLVDTTRLRLVRRSSIAPLDGMCKIVIIGEDNIICSFDYNLTTTPSTSGDRIYAPPLHPVGAPLRAGFPPSAGRCRPWACKEVSLAGVSAGRRTALGLGAAFRFLRPASLGERIGVAEGASLRQVVVEHSDGGGHGSHESSEPCSAGGAVLPAGGHPAAL